MSKFLADDLMFTFQDIPLDISEDDTDQWITDMLNKAAKDRWNRDKNKVKAGGQSEGKVKDKVNANPTN